MPEYQVLTCRCGAVLGVTDARRLRLGGVLIEMAVTLKCVVCQRPREWRPLVISQNPPPVAAAAPPSG